MADLYIAQLDGIELEIELIDDQFDKAIVRHEFPYTDGALLEDLGQKARTVRVRCWFWDDGDHTTYQNHIDLINHLESRELVELVHPMYGPMTGAVESLSSRHDDTVMTAVIDLTFVENLRSETPDVKYDDLEPAVEEAFIQSQNDMADSFSRQLTTDLGTEAESILAIDLDPDLPIIDQFIGITLKARLYLKTVDAYVRAVEMELPEIANPANSVIAAIEYGNRLPGRVIGATTRCLERYGIMLSSLDSAPVRFATSFQRSLDDLADSTSNLLQIRPSGASLLALLLAGLYSDDETKRSQLRKSEAAPGFDFSGRRVSESVEPIFTVGELEDSLAISRQAIQDAIDLDRTQTSLKTQARLLLEHVNTIKLEREKIVRINIDSTMPLHLVCLRYGLNYSYAERIHSINRLANPSFAAGALDIYSGVTT